MSTYTCTVQIQQQCTSNTTGCSSEAEAPPPAVLPNTRNAARPPRTPPAHSLGPAHADQSHLSGGEGVRAHHEASNP